MRFVWLWLLLCLLSPRAFVRADAVQKTSDAPPTVVPFASALRVEVISCVLEASAVDVSEMLAIARAELAPHVLVRADENNVQPLLRVDACHDERLVLRVLSPEGPEQSVALHDVPPEHRPRVAALALAELVLAARADARSGRERSGQREQPEPSEPKPAEPPSTSEKMVQFPEWNPPAPARPASRLGLGSEVRLFIESLSVSYGPRLSLRLPRVDLALVGLISRQRAHKLGELETGLVAMSASYHVWRSTGTPDVAVSIGVELGVTWGRAEPARNVYGERARAQAQFASAFGQLSLGGAISDQAYAHAGLAAGYALGVHAEVDGVKAGTKGAFAGLSAGLAWLL